MNDDLVSLAEAQHGLLSRRQALRRGLTPGQCSWLTRGGDWIPVYAGVYRLAGSPATWEQTLLAGCLAVNGIASHRAAGALWGLPGVGPALEITLLRPHHANLDGFKVHVVRRLERVDRTRRHGIPLTALPRTVIDLSLAYPDEAPAWIDHVLARRLVPLSLLWDRLRAAGTRGRAGAKDVRHLLEQRQGRLRHVDSGLQRRCERLALEAARAGRLPAPTFEHAVQLANGQWRYPDVAYPELRVGFEVQSYEHHSTLQAFARDQARNLELFAQGWIIVPVTAREIRDPKRLVEVMARILDQIRARTPRPAGP